MSPSLLLAPKAPYLMISGVLGMSPGVAQSLQLGDKRKNETHSSITARNGRCQPSDEQENSSSQAILPVETPV
jgi:hypothetical protein